MNKKANTTLYIAFLVTAIVIIMITAFAAPLGVLFNVEMYKAGEMILSQANESIEGISNATVRDSIRAGINSGFAAEDNNIEVNNNLFRYSWILIVGLTAVMIFLFTRRMVEYQQGGFI